jgi:hypothetical protein
MVYDYPIQFQRVQCYHIYQSRFSRDYMNLIRDVTPLRKRVKHTIRLRRHSHLQTPTQQQQTSSF